MKYLAPLAFLLLACGDDTPGAATPDASSDELDAGVDGGGGGDEIAVTVWVSGPPAAVMIDGVAGSERDMSFETLPATLDVTLVDDELEIDREVLALQAGVDDCNFGQPEPRVPLSLEVSMCGWANGELRYASTEIVFADTTCVLDGFCLPICEPTLEGFCKGEKCSSTFAAVDEPWSRLECVAAGEQLAGEACAFTEVDGRYVDDCARGLFCVADVCEAQCVDTNECEDGETCATPTGHAVEVKVCLPD
jgi:hypothetical protein